ncbi:MAG: pyridoxine 5'-phosphate synthase, partial [Chitinivibrionales bacterium]|nr:pyridoxine 5'-phosphate synthase [Chitinivibrionales bacterium]
DTVLEQFRAAATHAQALGLGVNAGHDLNLANLPAFLTIPAILEVSIGHAVIVESLDYGFDETIRRYVGIVAKT